MPIEGWYLTLFCLGAGLAIAGFWTVVLVRGALLRLLPGPGARDHVVAELLTAVLLLAGGGALLADHEASWAIGLAGMGLGALVYALAGSPGLYPGSRALRAAFTLGWLFAIPAIVSLLVAA